MKDDVDLIRMEVIRMDAFTVVSVIGVILGSIIFRSLNKVFTIFYFGFKSMFMCWMACVIGSIFVLGTIAQNLGFSI